MNYELYETYIAYFKGAALEQIEVTPNNYNITVDEGKSTLNWVPKFTFCLTPSGIQPMFYLSYYRNNDVR